MRVKRLGIILETIGVFFLVVVILLCAPLTLPRMAGFQVYAALSDNVGPHITEGSLVYVKPEDAVAIQSGDIVAYYSSAGGVSLREVTKNTPEDNELTAVGNHGDGETILTVSYSQVLGMVKLIIPKLGFVMIWAATMPGVLTIVCVFVGSLALIVVGIWIRREKLTPEKKLRKEKVS